MTAEERASRAARDTPLKKSRRQLYTNASIGNVLLMLGNISHWLKEAGVHDAFAVGTVFFVPFGLLYMLAAGYWLLRFTYLTWKEEWAPSSTSAQRNVSGSSPPAPTPRA